MKNEIAHSERKHSKFSASGSERWLNCAASVELEEKSPPSKDTYWSIEGTLAHQVLEDMLRGASREKLFETWFDLTDEMYEHVFKTALKMKFIWKKTPRSKFYVEVRLHNKGIHEEMFGTTDGLIVQLGGELHIIDFKYGKGHVVEVENNTQLIQYALAAAEKYNWNFKTVTMHILQPRAGEKWHRKWTIPISELKNSWQVLWHKGVARVVKGGNKPMPGSWCYWCRAGGMNETGKVICTAKLERTVQKDKDVFDEI